MSDDTTKTETVENTDPTNGAAAAAAVADPSKSIEDFSPEAQDYIKRLRSENADRRTAIKERDKKIADLEAAGLTEQQRKDKELEDAKTEASTTAAQLLRFQVAADKGVPLKLAERLKGNTKEELEADAAALKKEFGISDDGQAPDAGGFDGGVRRPVSRPKTMNDLLISAVRGG